MPEITADPRGTTEEFQAALEGYFLSLEEAGVPGVEEFEAKLLTLHAEERDGFTLDEASEIIREFEQSFWGTPYHFMVYPILIGDLLRLYQWVCSTSPVITESSG